MRTKETSVAMPCDLEAIKVVLEGAEIDYDENLDDNDLTLENGIRFEFDDDGKLEYIGSAV